MDGGKGYRKGHRASARKARQRITRKQRRETKRHLGGIAPKPKLRVLTPELPPQETP